MRTLYTALAIVLALFATGKLPMQKNDKALPLFTPAVAKTPAEEAMVPVTKYVSKKECVRSTLGSRNCKETLTRITVMVQG